MNQFFTVENLKKTTPPFLTEMIARAWLEWISRTYENVTDRALEEMQYIFDDAGLLELLDDAIDKGII